jgi:hypothetical protein
MTLKLSDRVGVSAIPIKHFFQSATQPVNPSLGDDWLNPATGILLTYVTQAGSDLWVDLSPDQSLPAPGKKFTQGTTAPLSPVLGDDWLDDTTGTLYTYVAGQNGTFQWVELGPIPAVTNPGRKFTQATTAPASSNLGDDWLDDTTGRLFTYVLNNNGVGTWVELGPTMTAIQAAAGKQFTQATTAPVSPRNGDDWLDETTGTLYTYIAAGGVSQWVELSPQPSPPVPGKQFTQGTVAPVTPAFGDDWLDDGTGNLYTWVKGASNVGQWVELGPGSPPGKKFTQSLTAPTSPSLGDDWLDDSTSTLMTYVLNTSGVGVWVELGPAPVIPPPGKKFTQATTAPASPNLGDDWLNTTTSVLYTYVTQSGINQWVNLAPIPVIPPAGKKFTQGTTAPVSPSLGDDWLDDSTNTLYTYVIGLSGTNHWAELGPSIPPSLNTGKLFSQGTTSPVSPKVGDDWLNETTGIVYTYITAGGVAQWVELGPAQPANPTGKLFTQGNTAPASPTVGDDWLDETTGTLYTYVAGTNAVGQWTELGPIPAVVEPGKKFTQGTTAPVSPVLGDDWLDENSGKLYTYVVVTGGAFQWAELGPAPAAIKVGKLFTQSTVAPTSPSLGDDWLDENSGNLYTFVAGVGGVGQWTELGPTIAPGKRFTQSATAPGNPSVGDDWLDDTTSTLLTFVAGTGGVGQWAELGPTPSVTASGKKFTQSVTAPTTPAIGDDWLDETSGTLFTFINDGVTGLWAELGAATAPVVGTVITVVKDLTASAAFTGVVTESAAIKTLNLPGLVSGQRVKISGRIDSSNDLGSTTLKIKLGGTVIATLLNGGAHTANGFTCEVLCLSTTSQVMQAYMTGNGASSAAPVSSSALATAVNTALPVDLTVTFTNSISAHSTALTYLLAEVYPA